MSSPTDSTVLARLGDDLDEFSLLVRQHEGIFPPDELQVMQSSISAMQLDIRMQYRDTLDQSHHGRPPVLIQEHSGGRGRPRYIIDRDWLAWAYQHRSTSGIAQFLQVSRSVVRNALLEYGLAQPQASPFPLSSFPDSAEGVASDDLLDPQAAWPAGAPVPDAAQLAVPPQIASYTGPLSSISDDALDDLIRRLRQHYIRAGLTMLDGMLRRLGHQIPRTRIRESLLRIDPVHRVFDRIRIRRRKYQVAGPNALWHHDGQHGALFYQIFAGVGSHTHGPAGLIRWKIVIHGFIDGYSRLIAALRAHNNNRAATVLLLFLMAAYLFGVPSRVRGDHGVENLAVAEWMETNRGGQRGSYIWGRSIHNVRIERLWVDVTAQVGAKWADFFSLLEVRYSLDPHSDLHIWLLHYLFLDDINAELQFFAEAWNHHRIQMRDGPNRSPADMFGFDMLVHGVRGDQLPDEALSAEELEVYGVDWEALREEQVLHSHHANNTHDGGLTSWIGRTGPPEHLNEVDVQAVEEPALTHLAGALAELQGIIQPWAGHADRESLALRWVNSLVFLQTRYPDVFM
ncbi:hypothetical protein EVJ58_g10727 [Rhodofomes roseus]|uniref:Integrase catalytic domain-containing protein n=1 Tax=Rhodofomes roseus TaxID=34475 RepID=A0A4Y9XM24_9APHY|nr:hypothetical protein EVJ58_g10727 [Rhodofomes roseus]